MVAFMLSVLLSLLMIWGSITTAFATETSETEDLPEEPVLFSMTAKNTEHLDFSKANPDATGGQWTFSIAIKFDKSVDDSDWADDLSNLPLPNITLPDKEADRLHLDHNGDTVGSFRNMKYDKATKTATGDYVITSTDTDNNFHKGIAANLEADYTDFGYGYSKCEFSFNASGTAPKITDNKMPDIDTSDPVLKVTASKARGNKVTVTATTDKNCIFRFNGLVEKETAKVSKKATVTVTENGFIWVTAWTPTSGDVRQYVEVKGIKENVTKATPTNFVSKYGESTPSNTVSDTVNKLVQTGFEHWKLFVACIIMIVLGIMLIVLGKKGTLKGKQILSMMLIIGMLATAFPLDAYALNAGFAGNGGPVGAGSAQVAIGVRLLLIDVTGEKARDPRETITNGRKLVSNTNTFYYYGDKMYHTGDTGFMTHAAHKAHYGLGNTVKHLNKGTGEKGHYGLKTAKTQKQLLSAYYDFYKESKDGDSVNSARTKSDIMSYNKENKRYQVIMMPYIRYKGAYGGTVQKSLWEWLFRMTNGNANNVKIKQGSKKGKGFKYTRILGGKGKDFENYNKKHKNYDDWQGCTNSWGVSACGTVLRSTFKALSTIKNKGNIFGYNADGSVNTYSANTNYLKGFIMYSASTVKPVSGNASCTTIVNNNDMGIHMGDSEAQDTNYTEYSEVRNKDYTYYAKYKQGGTKETGVKKNGDGALKKPKAEIKNTVGKDGYYETIHSGGTIRIPENTACTLPSILITKDKQYKFYYDKIGDAKTHTEIISVDGSTLADDGKEDAEDTVDDEEDEGTGELPDDDDDAQDINASADEDEKSIDGIQEDTDPEDSGDDPDITETPNDADNWSPEEKKAAGSDMSSDSVYSAEDEKHDDIDSTPDKSAEDAEADATQDNRMTTDENYNLILQSAPEIGHIWKYKGICSNKTGEKKLYSKRLYGLVLNQELKDLYKGQSETLKATTQKTSAGDLGTARAFASSATLTKDFKNASEVKEAQFKAGALGGWAQTIKYWVSRVKIHIITYELDNSTLTLRGNETVRSKVNQWYSITDKLKTGGETAMVFYKENTDKDGSSFDESKFNVSTDVDDIGTAVTVQMAQQEFVKMQNTNVKVGCTYTSDKSANKGYTIVLIRYKGKPVKSKSAISLQDYELNRYFADIINRGKYDSKNQKFGHTLTTYQPAINEPVTTHHNLVTPHDPKEHVHTHRRWVPGNPGHYVYMTCYHDYDDSADDWSVAPVEYIFSGGGTLESQDKKFEKEYLAQYSSSDQFHAISKWQTDAKFPYTSNCAVADACTEPQRVIQFGLMLARNTYGDKRTISSLAYNSAGEELGKMAKVLQVDFGDTAKTVNNGGADKDKRNSDAVLKSETITYSWTAKTIPGTGHWSGYKPSVRVCWGCLQTICTYPAGWEPARLGGKVPQCDKGEIVNNYRLGNFYTVDGEKVPSFTNTLTMKVYKYVEAEMAEGKAPTSDGILKTLEHNNGTFKASVNDLNRSVAHGAASNEFGYVYVENFGDNSIGTTSISTVYVPEVLMRYEKSLGDFTSGEASTVWTMGEQKRKTANTAFYLFKLKNDDTYAAKGKTKGNLAATGNSANGSSTQTFTSGSDISIKAKVKVKGYVYGYALDQISVTEDKSKWTGRAYKDQIPSDRIPDWGNDNVSSLKNDFTQWVKQVENKDNYQADFVLNIKKSGTGSPIRYNGFSASLGKFSKPISDGEGVKYTNAYPLTFRFGELQTEGKAGAGYRAMINQIKKDYGDTTGTECSEATAKQIFKDSGIEQSVLRSIQTVNSAENKSQKGAGHDELQRTGLYDDGKFLTDSRTLGTKNHWYDEAVRTFVVRRFTTDKPLDFGTVMASDKVDYDNANDTGNDTHTAWFNFNLYFNPNSGNKSGTKNKIRGIKQMFRNNNDYYSRKGSVSSNASKAQNILINNTPVVDSKFNITSATTNSMGW